MKSTKRLVSFLICFFMMFQLCAGVLAEGVTTNVVNNKDEVEIEGYKEIDASLNEVSQKIEAKVKPTSIRIPEEEETLPFYIDSEVNGDEIDTYFVLQGEFDGDETLSLSVYDGDNELLAEEIDCDSERIELSGIETGKEYYVEFVSSKEIDVDVLLGIADHFVDTADYEKKYICRYKVNVELENEQIEYVENEFFDVNYIDYYRTRNVAQNIEKIRQERGLAVGEKLVDLNEFLICPEGEGKVRSYGYDVVEQKYNGSFEEAQEIEDDDNVMGWIANRGEEDYYKIEFSKDYMVNFWLGDVPRKQNYNIYVYDCDEKLLYEGESGGDGCQELIEYVPINGGEIYYIKVEGDSKSDYDEAINYSLRAKYKSKVEKDDYEDNNNIEEAKRILTLNKNKSSKEKIIEATLHDSDDEDYYEIKLEKNARVEILLENIPEYCDYDLELCDGDQESIEKSSKSRNKDEEMDVNVKKGTYYVIVFGGFSDEEYSLTITINEEETIEDDNESMIEAERLFTLSDDEVYDDKTIESNIYSDDDDDYYRVDLDSFAKLDIEINGRNTQATLYDENKKTIETFEDEITRILPEGEYYIDIYGEEEVDYELTVKAKAPEFKELVASEGRAPLEDLSEYSYITIYNPDKDRVEKYNKNKRNVAEQKQIVYNEFGLNHGPMVASTGMHARSGMDLKMDRFNEEYLSWTPDDQGDFGEFYFFTIIDASPADEIWDTIEALGEWHDTGDFPEWYVVSWIAPEFIARGMKKVQAGQKVALKGIKKIVKVDMPDGSTIKKAVRKSAEGMSELFKAGTDVFNKFDVANAYVKPKHLANAGGKARKFLGGSKAEAEQILRNAMQNGKIVDIIDDGMTALGNQKYRITLDAGETIGTKGESLIRIILSDDGGMLSAFPTK